MLSVDTIESWKRKVAVSSRGILESRVLVELINDQKTLVKDSV